MTQFYYPDRPWPEAGGTVRLEGDEARHARDVQRLDAGDRLRLFDGLGRAVEGTIMASDRSALSVRIDRALPGDPTFPVSLDLGQALMPGQTMDDIVRQATELGAARIWPIACDRSVARVSAEKRGIKTEHWKKTALAACKQCDRNTLPEIMPIGSLSDVLGHAGEYGQVLAACPQAPQGELEIDLHRLRTGPARVLVLIGPEGDFSPEEVVLLRSSGVTIVTLGPLILKSDTAAAAAIAVLQHRIRRSERP